MANWFHYGSKKKAKTRDRSAIATRRVRCYNCNGPFKTAFVASPILLRAFLFTDGVRKLQSRRTRAGSVRLARHAGNREAERAVIAITANADPNTNGSCGLTL